MKLEILDVLKDMYSGDRVEDSIFAEQYFILKDGLPQERVSLNLLRAGQLVIAYTVINPRDPPPYLMDDVATAYLYHDGKLAITPFPSQGTSFRRLAQFADHTVRCRKLLFDALPMFHTTFRASRIPLEVVLATFDTSVLHYN